MMDFAKHNESDIQFFIERNRVSFMSITGLLLKPFEKKTQLQEPEALFKGGWWMA